MFGMANITTYGMSYTKLILATIITTMSPVSQVHGEETTVLNTETSIQSKEQTKVSDPVSTDDELSKRIKQLIKSLEYPDKIAEDFDRMVMDWKDEFGRPVLIIWKDRLINAYQDYQEGKISRIQVANIEENVLEELGKKIKKEFSSKRVFELGDVIENRQANCLGYSQLVYIIGNAIGLSVRSIDVLDQVVFVEGGRDAKGGHVACIVDLFDGQVVIADMTWFYEISLFFKLKDQFVKVGNYWELKNKDNPLLVHTRIRLLDKRGLLAGIHNSRGVVYKSRGEYDRAILEYNKAIEIDPGSTKAYHNRGNAYQEKSEYDRAIRDYTMAIEIDPNYAIAYTGRGNVFNAKGEYVRAIEDYTKAIQFDPKFVEAYNNRGITYAYNGEYDRAILDFTKVIEIDPKYTDAYINRGCVYENKGKYDRAIQDYIKVIEIDPEDASAYNNRGNIYTNKGEYDRAILDYDKAIEIDPKYAVAHYNRGNTYYKKDEYDRAILDYDKAIEIDPYYAVAYNNRGTAYYEKGEYDRAILDYDKVIEINPGCAVAYLDRGEFYAELGKSEEAKKDLLKALELDPELRDSVKKISEQYEFNLKLD
ncbi:MAG: tetratricopeptide repeat protein [Sedimentisphaerales bacterium]|nr:tetratricopeptide repeat protein [Sedimentisphaerales bacterium]